MSYLTPEEREIERLDKQIQRLDKQLQLLNRLMPHIGETCKWRDDTGNPFPPCKANNGIVCYKVDQCVSGEWELKD